MKVEIDPAAGFCGGVQRAIRIAEKTAKEDGPVYSLGQMVHNEKEVARLEKLGVQVINCEQIDEISGGRVILRAHGEPPSTYERLLSRQIEIVDTTCPIVLKLQDRIKTASELAAESGGTVMVFGKTDHPEVIGLSGQAEGLVRVVGNRDEAETVELDPPVYLFSQTTMSREEFERIASILRNRLDKESDLIVNDTICGQVYGRGPHLKSFAASHNVMIFLSGKMSSNGQYLFSLCKEANPNSFFISGIEQIQPEWFNGVDSVGISGAASTPVKDLVETARLIENL